MTTEPRGCLGFLARVFPGLLAASDGQGEASSALPPVIVNKFFVSQAEGNFFRVLRSVVGQRGHVLAQVSLRQLFFFPGARRGNSARASWQNRIAAKSVDFLVCDPATLRPLVAIELDEPSHAKPERQTRDDQVQAVFDAANLPLLRLNAERTYDTRELAEALGEYLA